MDRPSRTKSQPAGSHQPARRAAVFGQPSIWPSASLVVTHEKRIKLTSAGILEQSMGVRNRVGIGLSYRPDRQHRLAESIPWNRFLGYLIV
jgi:hypothetical protein